MALIERLPFSRQMNATQALLVKLTPSWLAWTNIHLPASYLNTTRLIAVTNNELSISCENANCATQIKHQQHSLLDYLHAKGHNNIEHIRIRLAMPKLPDDQRQHAKQNHLAVPNNSLQSNKPSDTSIKAIQSCQKRVNNEQLASSLARLSETLIKLRSH